MTDSAFVRVRREGGLHEITVAHPPLNILNGAVMTQLTGAFDSAAADAEAKVLLLRAEGKAFSAGADIEEHKPDKVHGMIAQFRALFEALDRVPYPTAAFVHGAALGGGCELALGCDVILASDSARFGQPEIGLGFLPPVAAALLPGRVGWGRALEICCSGRPVKADEALAMGLVTRLFPQEGAQDMLGAYLAPFLKQSPLTLRLTKKALRGGGLSGFHGRLEVAERIFLDELMNSQDVLEGLAAFEEKREPRWKNA